MTVVGAEAIPGAEENSVVCTGGGEATWARRGLAPRPPTSPRQLNEKEKWTFGGEGICCDGYCRSASACYNTPCGRWTLNDDGTWTGCETGVVLTDESKENNDGTWNGGASAKM